MSRLTIFNCKGGVGKTTTTMNLSAAVSRSGRQVTLLDFDPQCHLTRIINAQPKDYRQSVYAHFVHATPLKEMMVEWPGIGWLLPAHVQLMKVDSLFGKGPRALGMLCNGLDQLDQSGQRTTLIDCCPYVGLLSLNAIFASDAVLIPVAADYLSFLGAKQIARTLAALEPVLKKRLTRRYVLTRVDRRRKLGGIIYKQMSELFGVEVCQTIIGENTTIAESPIHGQDVFSFKNNSDGARDYQELFHELVQAGLIT